MTDIVELLRNPPPHMGQDNWQVLSNKAAAEIERLRAINADMLAALKESVKHCEICGVRALAAITRAVGRDV